MHSNDGRQKIYQEKPGGHKPRLPSRKECLPRCPPSCPASAARPCCAKSSSGISRRRAPSRARARSLPRAAQVRRARAPTRTRCRLVLTAAAGRRGWPARSSLSRAPAAGPGELGRAHAAGSQQRASRPPPPPANAYMIVQCATHFRGHCRGLLISVGLRRRPAPFLFANGYIAPKTDSPPRTRPPPP